MRQTRFGFTIVAALIIGCGGSGDDDGSGGAVDDKPFRDLSAGEREQACELLEAGYDGYFSSIPKHEFCTLGALLGAQTALTDEAALREDCVAARDGCLDNYAMSPGFHCLIPDCDGTVAGFVQCYDDLKAFYSSGAYDYVPECETVTLEAAQAVTVPEGVMKPVSCVSVEEKCPSDDPAPPPPQDPLIEACTASCERFEGACGVSMDSSCAEWCGTEHRQGERNGCLAINRSFYECGRSSDLDCTQDNVRLAIDERCGTRDVTYCELYQGVSCGRAEIFDSYCADALPEQPEAFTCVSSAPYGPCVDQATDGMTFRCCPAGTTF